MDDFDHDNFRVFFRNPMSILSLNDLMTLSARINVYFNNMTNGQFQRYSLDYNAL